MPPTTAGRLVALAVVVLLGVGVGTVAVLSRESAYTLQVVMPNALGVVEGTPVQIDGRDAGRVSDVRAQGNQAVVTTAIDAAFAPVHAGTTITVEARSVLGERYLQIAPGPVGNPELPDAALLPAGSTQVVVEDLLEALNPETRAHLTSTIRQLDAALAAPNAQNLDETLRTAGPAVQALGQVLDAVGEDGPAIRTLVTNLRGVTQILAERKDGVAGTVGDLTRLTGSVAAQQQQLSDGLVELPSTLDALQGVLDRFPAATDELVPLLDDLRPAAARLPGVAADLRPVVEELRPTVALLRPTLEAADELLGSTPEFIDQTAGLLPELQTTVERVSPAVAYLRPYAPEVVGFAANWGSLFSTYDSQGHFAHPLVVAGKTALNNNPPITIPGEGVSNVRLPGENVGQPWTDANGSEPR